MEKQHVGTRLGNELEPNFCLAHDDLAGLFQVQTMKEDKNTRNCMKLVTI